VRIDICNLDFVLRSCRTLRFFFIEYLSILLCGFSSNFLFTIILVFQFQHFFDYLALLILVFLIVWVYSDVLICFVLVLLHEALWSSFFLRHGALIVSQRPSKDSEGTKLIIRESIKAEKAINFNPSLSIVEPVVLEHREHLVHSIFDCFY